MIISFRMLEIANTWVLMEAAMLMVIMHFTPLSSLRQPVVPGRFLGTPPLLRLSKSSMLFLPPLLLISTIAI